jgi:quercetin dioxygenase-like cupin family protein
MPKRRDLVTGLALCVAVMAAASIDTAVLAQADRGSTVPRGHRVIAESRFVVTNAAAQTDLVQLVVDFEPGAWTSLHTHGGQAINLVLEGEITLRHGGMDRPHKAGQSWTDSTSQVHAAGNTGSGKARLLTNFLLPKGAPQITVVQESQFGPAVTYEAKFPLPPLPAEAEIIQQVVDLSSGWRTQRAYNGFAAGIVIEGEVTYQIGPERKPYKPGDAWMAKAGMLITEENTMPKQARVFRSYLVPKGAAP